MAAAVHLTLIAPDNEKFTVRSAPARLPRRKPNAEYRSREHLTEHEVERLIEAMKGNRWGHRDATMILIAFRHGLRASELVDLRWDQIDLEHALLHVRIWQPYHAPIDRQGTTRPEAATTRARVKVTIRVQIGTRHALHQARLSGDGRASR
jgi:integrase